MFTKLLKFISIIGLTVLMLAVFVTPVGAVTANILNINFENTPLFSDINFMPGDSITRYVEVTNTATETNYTIATKADNVVNSDGLGDAMELTIFEHANPGNIFYTGTLTQFFNAGVVELSTLTPGQYIKYDYSVYFQAGSSNAYQGKSLSFDIIVGDGNGESIGGEPGGGGGGGGGGYTHHNLMITNEALPTVNNTDATITWQTRDQVTSNLLAATSRVIYDTVSHPDLSGCLAPNYCYSSSNIEDSTKVFSHSMTITGLTAGTTYYFRPVSHASPEKTGIELSFTTSINNEPPIISSPSNGGPPISVISTPPIVLATPPIITVPAGVVAGEQTTPAPTPTLTPTETGEPQVKGASVSCLTCPWWVWLVVIILQLWSVFTYNLFKNNQAKSEVNISAEQLTATTKKSYISLWYLLVAISLIIIYLLLTLICKLPATILAILLLVYFTVLILHYFIKVKQFQGLWGLVPVLLALGPIIVYFSSGSWSWWLWTLVLALYTLSLVTYYFSTFNQNRTVKWWQVLLFLALLTIILEYILYLHLPCLGA